MEAVGPELAVVSVGADNRFGHPHEVTLEKLRALPIHPADQDGTMELVAHGELYWMRTDL